MDVQTPPSITPLSAANVPATNNQNTNINILSPTEVATIIDLRLELLSKASDRERLVVIKQMLHRLRTHWRESGCSWPDSQSWKDATRVCFLCIYLALLLTCHMCTSRQLLGGSAIHGEGRNPNPRVRSKWTSRNIFGRPAKTPFGRLYQRSWIMQMRTQIPLVGCKLDRALSQRCAQVLLRRK